MPKNPPIIIIHGNNLKKLPRSYKKYIENYFREGLNLKSTPVVVEFIEGKNPFKKNSTNRSKSRKRKI